MRKIRTAEAFFFLLLAVASAASVAGPREPTGVGSGGDEIDRFLANARHGLAETLRHVRSAPPGTFACRCADAEANDPLCRFLAQLTPAQAELCASFVTERAERMLALAVGPSAVPFTLSDKPLLVPDPAGNLRPVIAATQAGPDGGIVFHREGLRDLSPVAALALIAHEIGHKVPIPGGGFVDDNLPVGPFNVVGGGRLFLDAVGAALGRHASEHGFTVRHFGIRDRYACEAAATGGGGSFLSSGTSPRLFRGPALDGYESGVGNWPQDFACGLRIGGAFVELRAIVRETQGCRDGGGRSTRLELWRRDADPGDRPPALVAEREWAENPICPGSPSRRFSLAFRENGRPYVFRLSYEGVAGGGRAGTAACDASSLGPSWLRGID